jgi:hypothetical protein
VKGLRPLVEASTWKSPTVIVLVLANLIPLYGVLVFGWETFPLVYLFWLENVVVGGFNVLKMLLAAPQSGVSWAAKLFLIPFFCVHYGMFTFVHGVFVVGFFGRQFRQGAAFPDADMFLKVISEQHLWLALIALVISHGFSFGWNYLVRGEFRTASLSALMQQPYGRVVVLHVAILGGAFLLMALGSPVAGLVLLVGLKIALDVRAHLRQHTRPPVNAALPG